jgi:uncharacterized protein YjeT (DUF2065 family)
MSELLTAMGLVLVLEGLVYAVAPGSVRRMMDLARSMSDEQFRLGGTAAIGAGVAIVWLVRAVFGGS